MPCNGDMISAAQVRAGRAMLEWTRAELAGASKVSESTIADYEKGRNASMLTETAKKLIAAFANAGVEFTDADKGHGAGVRWKKPEAAE